MAYTDRTTGKSQRATVMVTVALIQGAAIIALINGFTVDFIKRDELPNPVGENITVPLPPPPPVLPQDPAVNEDKPITRTTAPLDLGKPVYDPPVPPQAPTGSEIPVRVDPIPPQPPLAPIAQPTAPRPIGRAGDWVTSNDYPSRDLREGNQGVTGFTLTIGASGRVQSCMVTAPSGFPGLDAATCAKLTARARFKPATDGGQPVAGIYSSKIRWEIPD